MRLAHLSQWKQMRQWASIWHWSLEHLPILKTIFFQCVGLGPTATHHHCHSLTVSTPRSFQRQISGYTSSSIRDWKFVSVGIMHLLHEQCNWEVAKIPKKMLSNFPSIGKLFQLFWLFWYLTLLFGGLDDYVLLVIRNKQDILVYLFFYLLSKIKILSGGWKTILLPHACH